MKITHTKKQKKPTTLGLLMEILALIVLEKRGTKWPNMVYYNEIHFRKMQCIVFNYYCFCCKMGQKGGENFKYFGKEAVV